MGPWVDPPVNIPRNNKVLFLRALSCFSNIIPMGSEFSQNNKPSFAQKVELSHEHRCAEAPKKVTKDVAWHLAENLFFLMFQTWPIQGHPVFLSKP